MITNSVIRSFAGLLFFSCAFFLPVYSAQAQLNSYFQVGVNFSSIYHTGSMPGELSGIQRLNLGFGQRIGTGWDFPVPLSFAAEINFSYKGYKQAFDEESFIAKTGYFNTVLTAHYQVLPFLAADAGLFWDALFSANTDFDNANFNIEENYNRTEWGWVLGLSLFDNERVGLSIRYLRSLSPTIEEIVITDYGEIAETVKAKNQLFQLNLRYNFPLK